MPRLSDGSAESHHSELPDLPPIQGEHGQILGWIHRALIVVQSDSRDVQRRIAHLEGGEEERAAWRRGVDEKLASIAASMGDGVTGWRVLLTQRNLPLVMMGVLVLFLCAVLWGVLFGAADIDHKLERIRGITPHEEAPARE